MIYIGIDPGKKGAMAILNGDEVTLIPWDLRQYIQAILDIGEEKAFCIVESVAAMPGQGVTSMFSFGENFGMIQGVLAAMGIPYQLVKPRQWKKAFSVTGDKNTSVAVCKRLFPDVVLRRTERCRKDDDNLAEALLMAFYAKRQDGG